MPSLLSRAVPLALTLLGTKKPFQSADATRALVAALQVRPASYSPPKHLDNLVTFNVRTVHGWVVYEVIPRLITNGRRALYLHGGAGIQQIHPLHWHLIAELAATTGSRFTVPIYPLAPVGTIAGVIPRVTDLAAELIAEVGADHTAVVADSAGATMALSMVVELRNRGLPPLYSTVLISPPVDLTFSDPQVARIAPRDPFLALPGTLVAAQMWLGNLDLADPQVSPINADLTGLGPITLFSGTRDLLNPDARRLAALAAAAGVAMDYHEVPDMVHVYPLLPIPEGRAARTVIRRALTA